MKIGDTIQIHFADKRERGFLLGKDKDSISYFHSNETEYHSPSHSDYHSIVICRKVLTEKVQPFFKGLADQEKFINGDLQPSDADYTFLF